MISKDIDKLILQATKEGKKEYLKVLKLVKAELQKAKCKAGRDSKVDLTEVEEAQVLLKMVEERKSSIAEYVGAKRQDLADIEQGEIDVIKEFLPEEASDEEIIEYTCKAVTGMLQINIDFFFRVHFL